MDEELELNLYRAAFRGNETGENEIYEVTAVSVEAARKVIKDTFNPRGPIMVMPLTKNYFKLKEGV